MGASGQGVPGSATFPVGIARITLAILLFAILILIPQGPLAFFSAGALLTVGVLLAFGRPRVLSNTPLALVALDSVLLGLLVAGTGGDRSTYFPLFFLAALGVFWVRGWARVAIAAALLAGGYLVAVGFADGTGALGTTPVGLWAGLLVLFCAAAGYLGFGARDLAGRGRDLSSALSAERDRTGRAEGLVSGFGPALEVLSLEEILSWTARTAREACGAAYAHVAALEGGHHASVLEGETDACPSWWHPSIQGLLLRASRGGETVRTDEEIHGTGGFLAVPVGAAGGGWGAVIVGGGTFGSEEERVLALISAAVGPALEAAQEAPGGRDPVSGLPNHASLQRVLRRELSRGRALTVFAVEVGGLGRFNRTHGFAAGDRLLRRVGERLGRGRRAFRYGENEFVVVLGGTEEARARRTALAIGQAVAEEGGDLLSPAVGFVHAGAGHEDPDPVLKTAMFALREARTGDDGVAGYPAPTEVPEETGGGPAGVVEALVGALEAKDPGVGEHLISTSRIAGRIAREMSLPEEWVQDIVVGALLHDVGKIGIPDQILHKPGRLTEEEYERMKDHPSLGVEIISPVGALAAALPAIEHHHERWDGKGYPDGLGGEDIPLMARVVAVADAFDVMCRDRPYGYGASREAALGEIERNAGTQFDPEVAAALSRISEDTGDRRADSTG